MSLFGKIISRLMPGATATDNQNKQMTPATIALLIAMIEEAIKIEPALAAELSAIFSKPNPTPEDWSLLRARVKGESFESLAPHAAANLPAAPAAPEVASAAPQVTCPKCGQELVPDSPANCACA
jgi:hypothetical protein